VHLVIRNGRFTLDEGIPAARIVETLWVSSAEFLVASRLCAVPPCAVSRKAGPRSEARKSRRRPVLLPAGVLFLVEALAWEEVFAGARIRKFRLPQPAQCSQRGRPALPATRFFTSILLPSVHELLS